MNTFSGIWKVKISSISVGNSEIGMSTNSVPITLQLVLIDFFPNGNSFIFKDAG